jgi:hypothetical protein
MTRTRIYDYLVAQAALLVPPDPLAGLLIGYDQSHPIGRGFGVILRNQEFDLCCPPTSASLKEVGGKLEMACYAAVEAASKRDRRAAYEMANAVAVWLADVVRADRTLGGAVQRSHIPKFFTSPDAKDAHPYVTLECVLEYPWEL